MFVSPSQASLIIADTISLGFVIHVVMVLERRQRLPGVRARRASRIYRHPQHMPNHQEKSEWQMSCHNRPRRTYRLEQLPRCLVAPDCL